MDPNQVNTNQNSTPSANPVAQPTVTTPAPSGSKLPWILALLALLLVLGAGGYYLYMNNTQDSSQSTYNQPATSQSAQLNSLESELNKLETESSDSGFTEVDKNLNNL